MVVHYRRWGSPDSGNGGSSLTPLLTAMPQRNVPSGKPGRPAKAALWLALFFLASIAAGCTRTSLRNQLFVGIERVRRAEPGQSDQTQRLLANLAAMPNMMVVDLGPPRNAHDFDSLSANKVRLFSGLEAGPFCLRASYGVFWAGQLRYSSGLAIPWQEVTTYQACIELFATRLYGDLVRQGL